MITIPDLVIDGKYTMQIVDNSIEVDNSIYTLDLVIRVRGDREVVLTYEQIKHTSAHSTATSVAVKHMLLTDFLKIAKKHTTT